MKRSLRGPWLPVVTLCLVVGCAGTRSFQGLPTERETQPPMAVSNDHRSPAGTVRDGVLELNLEARLARWRGEASDLREDATDPSVLTVMAFAEEGGAVSIPGPMIRVSEGTEVRVRVRNSIPDSVTIGLPGPALREEGMSSVAGDVLVVRGLRAGTIDDDVLRVSRGEVVEVRYRADRPGTYFYWATASERSIESWTGVDAQLAGVIIVDPAGTTPDPDERIFVITMVDQLPDPDSDLQQGDYFRRAINGRSWPNTERFEYGVGDTVRWRWINASFESHPMHLHGFHYRLMARGDWRGDSLLPVEERPLVVTEHMRPGSTFRMEWTPARAGNWIFHCHFLDHIVPTMERDEQERAHDLHDLERHALDAMGGLVLGMTVTDPEHQLEDDPPRQRLQLVALERTEGERVLRGFALHDGAGPEPTPDDLQVPGPPLLLTRGETTEIEVVNRLSEPTTIHWHGLELESVYDGVAGWSRTGDRLAPLVAPGESFAVRIRPPRAGTFIYHTHMDETDQLVQGMAGPFLVLDPGEMFDPEDDRVFLIGGQSDGDYPGTVNGTPDPPPQVFHVGQEYNLRLIHISQGLDAHVSLSRGGRLLRWRPLAKDGADLPAALGAPREAELHTQTGETFDFAWTPGERGEVLLLVRYERFFEDEGVEIRQVLEVR